MQQQSRVMTIPAILSVRHRAPAAAAAGNGLLNSLVTYWPLNEASGTRNDAHTNAYHLTETGTLGSTTGLVYAGAALYSESADNFLTRDRTTSPLINFSSSTPMTIAAWCYPTSFAGGPDTPNYYKLIADMNYASAFGGGYRMQTTADGVIYVVCGKTGGAPQYTRHVTITLNLNAWNLVVWTHDAGAMKYYHNGGTLSDSDTNSYAWTAASSGGFTVGARNASGGQYTFDGRLGPIAMWSRALSGADITALYNAGAGLPYGSFTT